MLEAEDIPRSRLLEAKALVGQFENVLSGPSGATEGASSAQGKDPDDEDAMGRARDVLKLHLAASELMSDEYDEAKQKIAEQYSQVGHGGR